MRLSVALVALLLAGSQAIAQTDGTAPVPVPEKKICKSIVPTGSIMGKRFCLTKTEWKQFDNANSRAVDALRNKGNNPCGTSGGPNSCQ